MGFLRIEVMLDRHFLNEASQMLIDIITQKKRSCRKSLIEDYYYYPLHVVDGSISYLHMSSNHVSDFDWKWLIKFQSQNLDNAASWESWRIHGSHHVQHLFIFPCVDRLCLWSNWRQPTMCVPVIYLHMMEIQYLTLWYEYLQAQYYK